MRLLSGGLFSCFGPFRRCRRRRHAFGAVRLRHHAVCCRQGPRRCWTAVVERRLRRRWPRHQRRDFRSSLFLPTEGTARGVGGACSCTSAEHPAARPGETPGRFSQKTSRLPHSPCLAWRAPRRTIWARPGRRSWGGAYTPARGNACSGCSSFPPGHAWGRTPPCRLVRHVPAASCSPDGYIGSSGHRSSPLGRVSLRTQGHLPPAKPKFGWVVQPRQTQCLARRRTMPGSASCKLYLTVLVPATPNVGATLQPPPPRLHFLVRGR